MTVSNTVSTPHAKSHAVAEAIAKRLDQHDFTVGNGSKTIDTGSTGDDHGWHDGTDIDGSRVDIVKQANRNVGGKVSAKPTTLSPAKR